MKILIVDDNAGDRKILRHYLAAQSTSVILEATDGAEGLVIARSERPDLIISDALMPNVDGFGFLREVRRSTELCGTPFIFYSAVYTGLSGQELAMSLGADAFLEKPLDSDEFLRKLRSTLLELDGTKRRTTCDILEQDEEYLKKYSQVVTSRLEQKVRELELLRKTLEAHVIEMVADQRRKDQLLIQQSRLAAMGEMIGNIAHQWRQPLNNIALIIQNIQIEFNSGLLTREEMDSDIHEAMEVILQMSHTIDDFRNFFRKEEEKSRFFISKAINGALAMVSANLKSQNIKVQIIVDENAAALGNQNEYAQVLLNLISNSSEACVERCVSDPCIFFRTTQENEHSVLYVSDNCGGIPDEILPKIFDPYFTTRGPDRGSGIGLYMSKVIIEQNMGGQLTVRNVDGGSEFRIEL